MSPVLSPEIKHWFQLWNTVPVSLGSGMLPAFISVCVARVEGLFIVILCSIEVWLNDWQLAGEVVQGAQLVGIPQQTHMWPGFPFPAMAPSPERLTLPEYFWLEPIRLGEEHSGVFFLGSRVLQRSIHVLPKFHETRQNGKCQASQCAHCARA